MKKFLSFVVALGVVFTIATAGGSPKVTLVSKQYKQVKYVDRYGRIRSKLKDIDRVVPGDTIVYKNIVSNFENKPLKNLVLNNKIPKHTTYIKHSGKCSSKCRILVSVNGGRTFVPENKVGNRKVTNVRWILLASVNPNSEA